MSSLKKIQEELQEQNSIVLDDKAMKEKNSADLLKAMKKSATANLEKKQEKAQKKAEKIP